MTVRSSSSGRCFIDTNIWLYALMLGQDQTKTTQAAVLIEREQEIVVSPQVINEVSVNLIKKAKFGEEEVRTIIADFYQSYYVLEFSEPILVQASHLRQAHRLAFWDSLMVASALAAGVSRIYSEDLHDGMVFANQTTVVNPFK